MGLFGWLSPKKSKSLEQVYSEYILHSINNNSEDEAYARLAAIKRSLNRADLAWLRQQAEAGIPEAMCLRAVSLVEGWSGPQDVQGALQWFQRAPDAGCASAQDTIAGFHSAGVSAVGIKRSRTEAIRYYRKAAEQGFAKSQSSLGTLLSEASSTAEEGLGWTRKAAEQGIWSAICNLAVAYAQGDGLPWDPELAATWYEKAAAQGCLFAQQGLERLRSDPLLHRVRHMIRTGRWDELRAMGATAVPAILKDVDRDFTAAWRTEARHEREEPWVRPALRTAAEIGDTRACQDLIKMARSQQFCEVAVDAITILLTTAGDQLAVADLQEIAKLDNLKQVLWQRGSHTGLQTFDRRIDSGNMRTLAEAALARRIQQ